MQLSQEDYIAIYDLLVEGGADKSAYLLKAMREKQISDNKVMEELDVNTNAYYTLRSRLNQKIEEYLLAQMESPRTDILKKVANINEILFTKKKAIASATLKKLEKELLDYDLSNELTVVYKALKKLHINSSDYYLYSQLYNRHVAYMLAVDKAEDLLAQYFIKFGDYSMNGEDIQKIGLVLLNKEMLNVCGLYESHRLYIYKNCMNIFHRLFVETEEDMAQDLDALEDIFTKCDEIFDQYGLDSIYYHLKMVYEFLKFHYYNNYRLYRKAENFYEEVNEQAGSLLTNFSLYTYPPLFLISKIQRHIRMLNPERIYEESEGLFQDFEIDKENVPLYVTYVTYRSLAAYYAGKYEEAARWINNLLNDVSLKKFPIALLEVKTLLALQYCCMKDFDLFNQLVNSIQRQIRMTGKENCMNVHLLTKMMKVSLSEAKRQKAEKIKGMIEKFEKQKGQIFSPTMLIQMDDAFVERLL